jgi:hypothetical protein
MYIVPVAFLEVTPSKLAQVTACDLTVVLLEVSVPFELAFAEIDEVLGEILLVSVVFAFPDLQLYVKT